MYAFFVCAIAYLIGSIPFGLLLTRMAGQGDIRAIGSGNIGATNVLRTGRKGLALATLLLDGGKGVIAVFLALLAAPSLVVPAALMAMLGHVYPVWLRFKGGKGVATGIGVWLVLCPLIGAAMIGVWIGMFAWRRISSLAALAAFGVSVPLAWIMEYAVTYAEPYRPQPITLAALCITALVCVRHRDNIARLLAGAEPRFGAPKA